MSQLQKLTLKFQSYGFRENMEQLGIMSGID